MIKYINAYIEIARSLTRPIILSALAQHDSCKFEAPSAHIVFLPLLIDDEKRRVCPMLGIAEKREILQKRFRETAKKKGDARS